jgi:hypothetical protein
MAEWNGRRHGADHVLAAVTVLRKRSGEIELPDPDDSGLAELASVVTNARAEMQRLVQLGELQDDPLRHPIQALAVHLDAMQKIATASTNREGAGQSITDKQIDDIGRRLLGSTQAWSRSFVSAAYWRSQATLAAVIIGVAALAFGAGWWMRAPESELACADQTDGSRLCWMYTRLPTAAQKR